MDDERETDGVRMKAVINEALGDVAGPNAFGGLAIVTENAFMHGWSFVSNFVVRLKQLAQIVGIEERVHGGSAKSVGTCLLYTSCPQS